MRNSRVEILLATLDRAGVRVWVDSDGRVRGKPIAALSSELRAELHEARDAVRDHLLDGEEIVDYTANDPEGKSHADMRSLAAPELSQDDKLRAGLKASKRSYQGGAVVVNGQNSMGAYMRRLSEQRERQQAAESGTLPPEGYYQRKWNIFG